MTGSSPKDEAGGLSMQIRGNLDCPLDGDTVPVVDGVARHKLPLLAREKVVSLCYKWGYQGCERGHPRIPKQSQN